MQETTSRNPWLDIPPDDYENHMSSPEVAQLQALEMLFGEILARFRPASMAIIGCSTGNGFEHIDQEITKRTIGIDINREYLDIAMARHSHIPGVRFLCADIAAADEIECEPVDLVHAALLFEYVNVKRALSRIVPIIKTGGILSVGLQLASLDCAPVTKTAYSSLEKLCSIMKLIDPAEFSQTAAQYGLIEIGSDIIDLQTGKKLFVGYYRKTRTVGSLPQRE